MIDKSLLTRRKKPLKWRFLSVVSVALATLLSFTLNVANANSIAVKNSTSPRVISLAPHITETLYSAGAGHLLVGVVEYSNYPEAAKALPLVGNHQAVNIEKIIHLKPDFIYAWQSSMRQQDVQRFTKLGYEVIYSHSNDLNAIAKEIRQIGRTLQTQVTAEKTADKIESELAKIKAKYSQKSTVKVFYQIWNKPLMTINGEQFISQGLDYCGAENIFSEMPLLAAEVNLESLFKHNPDVIILGGEGATQDAWLKRWQAYPQLKAVANNQIMTLNADLYQRPTERFVMNLDALCQKIDKARASMQKQSN